MPRYIFAVLFTQDPRTVNQGWGYDSRVFTKLETLEVVLCNQLAKHMKHLQGACWNPSTVQSKSVWTTSRLPRLRAPKHTRTKTTVLKTWELGNVTYSTTKCSFCRITVNYGYGFILPLSMFVCVSYNPKNIVTVARCHIGRDEKPEVMTDYFQTVGTMSDAELEAARKYFGSLTDAWIRLEKTNKNMFWFRKIMQDHARSKTMCFTCTSMICLGTGWW